MVSLFINGFSPVLPILIIFITLFFSLFVAWWSYQYLQQIEKRKKLALITLRALSLFILILMLLNPFIISESETTQQPSVAVYYDNSQSLGVVRGTYDGIDHYRSYIDQFRVERDDSFQYSEYLFGDEISESIDLNLTDTRTNINSIFEHLRERENRYTAAILFSDGIVTQGRNPLFSAQNLTIPVITIPLGDTSSVKDVAIANVDFSSSVYSFTNQSIQIEIQQEGYEGERADIQIFKDGELIENISMEFHSSTSSQVVDLIEEYNEPGFHQYEINIPPLPDEYTTQNNRTTFSVEVLDDKTQILSIALEIHPDVSSFRRVIATDQQNELSTTLQLESGRFIGVNPFETDSEPDLILLHGLPDNQSDLFQWIEQQRIPILFHLLPQSFENAGSGNMESITGFSISNISDPIQISFDLHSSITSHSILETLNPTTVRAPLLQTYRGNYNYSSLIEPLINSIFQRDQTDLPMILVEDNPSHRKATITTFGWYRYEQHIDPEIRDLFKNLLTNLVSWTSTSPERRTLKITPQKETYSESEIVTVRAELFNERGEPETEAFIDLSIYQIDSDEPLHQIRMNHQQSEIYSADLGNYPQGIYRLTATASKNERVIGRAENRVIVNESIVEYLNTKRDDQMLRQIAEITNGTFIDDNDLQRINRLLQNFYEERENQTITEEFYYLYRSGYWFLLVLLFLSAEWIIRRSVSLP